MFDARMNKAFRRTAAGMIGFAFCWMPSTLRAQTAKPNVVMIVLDQLQADQLHCYGNPRATSPNIDKLAGRGILFSHFYSVAPWTSPSFASLHTSLYPSVHGVTLFWHPGMPLIDKDRPTLAESFQSEGYDTSAFVDNTLAAKPLTGSGFDEYVDQSAPALDITARAALNELSEYKAPITTERVLRWLDNRQAEPHPFFLYVHYIEPHSPYNPPPQDDLFKSNAYPYLSVTGYDIAKGGLLRLAMTGDQDAVNRLYQLYDGKIHFVDRYVGEILDRLRALGLDGNTYVILTSDHGELLYSHPEDFLSFDHRSLYDAVLHIPLIIAGPDVPRGKTVAALGSNIDTAPTVLALAGAPPLNDAQGHSLTPVIQGRVSSVNSHVFAEEDVEIPERSVRNTRYKLIRNLWDGHEQLFDGQNDPQELHDVAKENPAIVKELDAQLDGWMRANEPSAEIQIRRERIYTQPESVVTVDDVTIGAAFLIRQRQAWHSDQSPASGNYDGSCFWTENGDGKRTAIWRSDNPLIGTYKVFVYSGHPKVGALATNAPFKIVTKDGTQSAMVNFQKGAGEWKLLGTFKDPRYVELSNAANGVVIADAVRFERKD